MDCKKIRRTDRVWVQMERYIRDHSRAEFSHGLCPDCYDAYCKQLSPGKSTLNLKRTPRRHRLATAESTLQKGREVSCNAGARRRRT